MGTLFLIGNGFDINCGMKTQYKDVYKGYVKEESTSENIKRFKKEIDANIENWGDFEMAMAKYAQQLNSEAELLECVRDFAKYMELHLLKELYLFKMKMENEQVRKKVIEEVHDSIFSFYTGISHNVDTVMKERGAGLVGNINAISFNYTDAFDKLFSEYFRYYYNGRSREVIHVHGCLQDDPVLGIDNVEQLKTGYILSRKGKRGFIKPVFNDEYDRQRVERAKLMINDADTICAFGMSLGESDLSWRNEIIEWLEMNESHHLLIYRYNLSTAEYKTVTEKMDIEDDEKEKILSEWGISSDSSVFEQIHIPCGKNIFNIQEAIENAQRENYENQKKELVEKIAQGEEFVNRHLQDALMA